MADYRSNNRDEMVELATRLNAENERVGWDLRWEVVEQHVAGYRWAVAPAGPFGSNPSHPNAAYRRYKKVG